MFRCELCGEVYAYEDEVVLLDCNDIILAADDAELIEHSTICISCYDGIYHLVVEEGNNVRPYSDEDYEDAKSKGYDLDDWNDYVKYFGLGEED